jgi:hypothetical protein
LAADASSIGFPASNCREFAKRATRKHEDLTEAA